ncbi:protein RRNAD1 [Diachasma alloeum]|uniref:protein RRNAD1 n=1 Tax=Diachasma alloeum TaxID=454923 RepID=UPI0007382CD2|nr:protein RRNAD1 [Diachasma alloeum]
MAARRGRTCTCRVCLGIGAIIDGTFRVLDLYGWMLDSYIVDFFQDDLWGRLPKPWARTLENVSLEELGSWILRERSPRCVWPLSLIALRQLIDQLSINRNPSKRSPFTCSSSQLNPHVLETSACEDIAKDERLTKFQNLFKKHVKEKKRYEIEKFSEIVARCKHLSKCSCIVDTGAGIGHLARELAYKYHLPVICIEQDKSLSELAGKYDEQFMKKFETHLPGFCGVPPYHLCAKIVDESCRGGELPAVIKEILRDYFLQQSNDNGFGLIGLHPCGDLAARLLKFYVGQASAKFISVVGCCYMKLTINEDETENAKGYPLSKYVARNSSHSLSYAALEVACHAVENYCDKIKNNEYEDLKVHGYRATLEKILIDKGGIAMRHGKVGSVRVNNQMSFEEYCRLATEKLDVNRRINISEVNHAEVEKCLTKWRHVVAFEALRFMLAPLVETVILLDRFLFLSDNNLKPVLKAEFDPRLSPRNFVLTSIK